MCSGHRILSGSRTPILGDLRRRGSVICIYDTWGIVEKWHRCHRREDRFALTIQCRHILGTYMPGKEYPCVVSGPVEHIRYKSIPTSNHLDKLDHHTCDQEGMDSYVGGASVCLRKFDSDGGE